MENDKEKMITKTALRERDWTEKLIELFLPIPNLEKPNPMYRRAGAPMKLFFISKIEEIENSKEFKVEKEKTDKRKISSEKAIKTKIEKLQKHLETVNVDLPKMDKDVLIKKACASYNNMQAERECYGRSFREQSASKASEIKFLNRICVNYLRHCKTDYEELLDEISGKVGFSVGYQDIRGKIFEKIIKLYPWLEEECKRQNGEIVIDKEELGD